MKLFPADKILRYFQKANGTRVPLTPKYGGRTAKKFPFPFLFTILRGIAWQN